MIGRMRRPSIAVAAALLVAMATGPASAALAPDPGPSTGQEPATQLVVPGTGEKKAPFAALNQAGARSLPGPEKLSGTGLRPADAAAAEQRLTMVENPTAPGPRSRTLGVAAQAPVCDSVIDPRTGVREDSVGRQVLRVDYYGDVLCNFHLIEARGAAGVIDRTQGFDGQVIHVGSEFHFANHNFGSSTGVLELDGDFYRGARSIEVAVDAYLLSAIPWAPCGSIPGLRYLACEIDQTGHLLHVIVGTGPFQSGLQDRLFMGTGEGEGCRITLNGGSNVAKDADGESRATITFVGMIKCSAGVTGTSTARLEDRSPTNLGVLKTGGDSGADGASQEKVEWLEGTDGVRRVQILYSGRTTAPAGRTWIPCTGTGGLEFSKCIRNGNVVEWEAFVPAFDTLLPDYLNCELGTYIGPQVQGAPPGTRTVTVGATVGCNAGARRLTVAVDIETEEPPDSTIALNIGENVSQVTAMRAINCDPSDTVTPVTYTQTARAVILHASGWEESKEFPADTNIAQCILDE
ncbi:MAG TPA: hypothetical protein VF062_04365 [Candidatus Limnocylindrales bacterium]